MARYIDADKLIDILKNQVAKSATPAINHYLFSLIDKVPVQEVVRCEDCKHYHKHCCWFDFKYVHQPLFRFPEDYCSQGKRGINNEQ